MSDQSRFRSKTKLSNKKLGLADLTNIHQEYKCKDTAARPYGIEASHVKVPKVNTKFGERSSQLVEY